MAERNVRGFRFGDQPGGKQIRAVLNDDPEQPRIIATVPKRGYRFIGKLADIGSENTRQQAASEPPTPLQSTTVPARARTHTNWRPVVLIALALAGLVGGWLVHHRGQIGGSQPQSLTVLPLASRDNPADQQLGLVLTDAIITKLGRTGQVQLRSTAAVRKFVSPDRDVLQIARDLKTDAVLDGRIERDGDQIRVRLQLISSRDGSTQWSAEIQQAYRPMFELEEELASRITEGLRLHLTAAQQAALLRRYTQNSEAYSAYLAGRAELLRYNRSGALEAVKQFQRALQLDPEYTLARSGLANASAQMYLRFAQESELAYWAEEAERENRRAVELEPDLAETHESLAAVYRQKDFNWDAVLQESRRALELNPTLSQPHYYIAAAYYHRGLLDEAMVEVRRAFELAPESRTDMLRAQGIIALYSGRYQDAVTALEEVERLSSKAIADPHLGMAYYYAGQEEKGLTLLRGVLSNGSASAEARARANLAAISAARHDETTARRMLKELEARSYRDHHVQYAVAETYAGLAQPQTATLNLRRAAETGLPCYPWFERDPLLNPVRSNPDFQSMMRDLKSQRERARKAAK